MVRRLTRPIARPALRRTGSQDRWGRRTSRSRAAVHVLPLMVRDPAGVLGRADPGAVVLQSAVDVVRPLHVDADVVELRNTGRFSFFTPLVAGRRRRTRAASSLVITLSVFFGSIQTSWKSPCAPPENAAEALAPSVLDDEPAVGLVDAGRIARNRRSGSRNRTAADSCF